MANEAHSPAPWKWNPPMRVVMDAIDDDVCRLHVGTKRSDEMVAANARLIAAAPTTKQQRDEAVALLRELQWVRILSADRCPSCNGVRFENGHHGDCKLAALLARIDGREAGRMPGELGRASLAGGTLVVGTGPAPLLETVPDDTDPHVTFECSRCKRLAGHRFTVGVDEGTKAILGGRAKLSATCEGCGNVDTYDVTVA